MQFFCYAKSLRRFNDSDRSCMSAMQDAREIPRICFANAYTALEIDSRHVDLITIAVTQLFTFKVAEVEKLLAVALKFKNI